MVSARQRTHAFSAEGEVVEILQDAGALRARVVLRPGTVIDVVIDAPDVHLGDWVAIDGSIAVECHTKHEAGASSTGAARRVNARCSPPE